MQIEFNLAIIGDQTKCPVQTIAVVRSTDRRLPIIQLTTTKLENETEDVYISRLRKNLRRLIEPYGYAHHIVLFCRNEAQNDLLSNDTFQNLAAKLRHIAKHSDSHMERVKALSLHLDLINSLEQI